MTTKVDVKRVGTFSYTLTFTYPDGTYVKVTNLVTDDMVELADKLAGVGVVAQAIRPKSAGRTRRRYEDLANYEREAIMVAYDRGATSARMLASTFRVTVGTVNRIIREAR